MRIFSKLTNKVSILEGTSESWSIAFGILFVLLGYVGLAFNPHFDINSLPLVEGIVAIVFLKTTHTIFTVTLFWALPEFRSLLRESIKERAPWIPMSALLIAVVVYRIFIYGNWKAPGGTDLVTAALLGITLTHATRQSFGLLLLYNRSEEQSVKLGAEKRNQLHTQERFERWLSTVLIFTVTVEPFVSLGGMALKNRMDDFIISFKAVLVFCLLALFWNHGRWKFSNKPLFSIRILALPFAYNSMPLLFVSGMIHGVESLLMCLKMARRSSERNPGLGRRPFWALMSSMAAFGPLVFAYYRFAEDPVSSVIAAQARMPQSDAERNTAILLLSAVVFAVGFLHNYVDSVIYRMRDPIVRRHIGPLVL